MSASSSIITRGRIEGLIILLVSAGYLWEAHNVPEFYKLPGVPGPTTFPLLLGIVFALCGLWLLVSPRQLIARRRSAGSSTPAPQPPAAIKGGRLAGAAAGWHFFSMWAVILAYLYLMPDLGFPAATVALIAGFLFFMGERRWPIVVGMPLGATLLIYVSFKMGLNVRLPLGILEPLFK